MRSARLRLGFVVLALGSQGCGDDKPTNCGQMLRDAAADAASNDAGVGTDGPDIGPQVIRVTTMLVNDLDDGLCSLSEAVAAANAQASINTNDCVAGRGRNTIELPPGTYESQSTLDFTQSVELRGAGMDTSTLVIRGDALTCGVRLASVGKSVWLTSLTLKGSGASAPTSATTGVCVTGGVVRIRHARVSGFTAGGLRAHAPSGGSAKLEIYNSLIDDNRNRGDGGGIAFIGPESWISIDQSSIVNNTSEGMGGGLFAAGGTNANYFINSTFSGNVARQGGGIAGHILSLTYFGVYWSTVVNNRALDVGGGLFVEGESLDAHGTATASIIAGNQADGDPTQANLNADWAAGFSCTSSILDIAGLAHQPTNIAGSCRYDRQNPMLGPLMDMGGADHLPIHALLPGSPAIDQVDGMRPGGIVEQRDVWNGSAGDPMIGDEPTSTPRWTLFAPEEAENPLSDIGPFEYNPRWEAELLAVADSGLGEHAIVAAPDGFSHGAGTNLRAQSPGAYVIYEVPVAQAGRHNVSLRIGAGPIAGRFQIAVSDSVAGPYAELGSVQDAYSALDDWKTLDVGAVAFGSPGQKFFKVTVVDKNVESQGYGFLLDFLVLSPS